MIRKDDLSQILMTDSFSSQSPDAPVNEDAVGSTCSAAWVIDGATGISDRAPLVSGVSDAAWLARILNSQLRVEFTRAYSNPLKVLADVQLEIESAYHSLEGAPRVPPAEQPSAAFVLVAIIEDNLQCVGVGDCRIVLEHKDGSITVFNPSEIGQGESFIIEERRRIVEAYPGVDPWPLLKPLIRSNREYVNMPGGYSIVHPTRHWVDRVKSALFRSVEIQHVLLVSDGLYRLVDVFSIFDAKALLRAALLDGLEHLCKRLRKMEKDDQTCSQFPRVKVTDDASGILLEIVGRKKAPHT